MGWERIEPNHFDAWIGGRRIALLRTLSGWCAWAPLYSCSVARTSFEAATPQAALAAVCAWYAGHSMPEMAAAVHALGMPEDA
jgi:hypothetical protein